MPSPLDRSPYEVLGVTAAVSEDELRRAYRRMLRVTHPDTGGDPARFLEVQQAWEVVGTRTSRAAYDAGNTPTRMPESRTMWMPAPPKPRTDTRPQARSYGHPGGVRREKYLELMREWSGLGTNLPDPYSPALVQAAPRDIRHLLADALAEEASASALANLGIGYTLWHDVDSGIRGGQAANKIDHIVLGPTGVFAILSEDWGAPVKTRRSDLIGAGLEPGERPMHALATRARAVSRASRVKFSAILIVVPDDAIDESLTILGSVRGMTAAVVHRSRLAGVLRSGLPGLPQIGGTELFEVRTRLQGAIRFV